MFKIKKKFEKQKPTVLYNVIEDYSDFDAPGNVTACATTFPEDLAVHAKVLSESYEVPLETMKKLLTEGGVYVYPQVGGVLMRGLFACRIDPTGEGSQANVDLEIPHALFSEAAQLAGQQARGIPLDEVAAMVFSQDIAGGVEVKTRTEKSWELDYRSIRIANNPRIRTPPTCG